MTTCAQEEAEGYYRNTREELIPLVEPTALRVLDIGCGAGRLGEILKKRVPSRFVAGVELQEMVASEARKRLDTVFTGDIQSSDLPFDDASFDCVILADVLEHLVAPSEVISRAYRLLRPGGWIVASIPNIRHYTAVLRLVRRGWFYEDFGLFDRTHVRFFSLQSMEALFPPSSWVIEMVKPRIVASRKARLANILCGKKLTEFLALQYLFRIRRVP